MTIFTVQELSGVGAKRAVTLHNAGIFTIEDLLNHFPRDYSDRSEIKTVSQLTLEAVNTIRGVIAAEPETAVLPRKNGPQLTITKAFIRDSTGALELVWFNQPYLKKNFRKGTEYMFTGMVRSQYGGRMQMQSPEYEIINENESLSHGRIVPVYTAPKGYSQKTFRALINQALNQLGQFQLDTKQQSCAFRTEQFQLDAKQQSCAFRTEEFQLVTKSNQLKLFPEFLPSVVREKYNLIGRQDAVQNIHFPKSDEMFLAARRRLVFEELFFMQGALQNMKKSNTSQPGVTLADTDISPFLQALPFSLTKAQEKVLVDIGQDISHGRRMNRLIQGDVGSGKTAVAMASAFIAAKNGYQTALMAPTEVLANQHYENCTQIFAPLGYETVLLTGSMGAKLRREALAKIQDGRAAIIVGTHALIQEKVEYHNLALAITDEQHRFGVNQRLSLSQKGETPHTLVMTATPIPRTLGMILYGDLDISIINELPPGRQVIKTYAINSKYTQRIRGFISKEVEAGRQAYVICPAIEESEPPQAEMKNVLAYTAELKNALPQLAITFLHGKMKPADKQKIMDEFKAGQINVLVSTTVIEVGVHVANATLMIIENAERFGLSQLHQLRGRVGRGRDQSYCVLITDTKNDDTTARMKAMCDTADGFKLAELDLKLRGTGDFFGTRQHGLPSFTIANLYRDMDILKEVQDCLAGMDSAELTAEEKATLRHRIAQTLETNEKSRIL